MHQKTQAEMNRAEPRSGGACHQQRCSHILISSRFKPVSEYTGISTNVTVRENVSCKEIFDSGFSFWSWASGPHLLGGRNYEIGDQNMAVCVSVPSIPFGKMDVVTLISELLWKLNAR